MKKSGNKTFRIPPLSTHCLTNLSSQFLVRELAFANKVTQ